MIRLGLWLLPFRVVNELLSPLNGAARAALRKGERSTERAVWGVQAATNCVPHATCLTQALAGQLLLGVEGIPASVHIAVAKERGGILEAHAWLDFDGKILIGGPDSPQKYTRLLPVDQWDT